MGPDLDDIFARALGSMPVVVALVTASAFAADGAFAVHIAICVLAALIAAPTHPRNTSPRSELIRRQRGGRYEPIFQSGKGVVPEMSARSAIFRLDRGASAS